MKNLIYSCLVGMVLFSCQPKLNELKFDGFAFNTTAELLDEKSSGLMEGTQLTFSLDHVAVELSSSYYSNNLYEYDTEIASSDDTSRIQNLKENQIPYVVAKRKSDVDLDYYRVYNVFFDTIRGIPLKILKPRVPFTNDYKVFVSKIPNTYKKNIGDKSLTIIFQNVKTESDQNTFDEFYKSMRYSGN
jgi:hypothetical protein